MPRLLSAPSSPASRRWSVAGPSPSPTRSTAPSSRICFRATNRPLDAPSLARVEKPARYVGGEYQEVRKDAAGVRARVCLAFPDVYEIGMSHLGTKILYAVL